MSRIFQFVALGEPRGQPRPRAFARKIGNTFTARVYDAGTAEGWKGSIALAAHEAGLDSVLLEGPILFSIHCHFRRPRSHYGSGKNLHVIKPAHAETRKISKPDLDNLLKAATDCLTIVGVWKDDSQIVHASVSKEWTDKPSFSEFYIIAV